MVVHIFDGIGAFSGAVDGDGLKEFLVDAEVVDRSRWDGDGLFLSGPIAEGIERLEGLHDGASGIAFERNFDGLTGRDADGLGQAIGPAVGEDDHDGIGAIVSEVDDSRWEWRVGDDLRFDGAVGGLRWVEDVCGEEWEPLLFGEEADGLEEELSLVEGEGLSWELDAFEEVSTLGVGVCLPAPELRGRIGERCDVDGASTVGASHGGPLVLVLDLEADDSWRDGDHGPLVWTLEGLSEEGEGAIVEEGEELLVGMSVDELDGGWVGEGKGHGGGRVLGEDGVIGLIGRDEDDAHLAGSEVGSAGVIGGTDFEVGLTGEWPTDGLLGWFGEVAGPSAILGIEAFAAEVGSADSLGIADDEFAVGEECGGAGSEVGGDELKLVLRMGESR